MTLRPDSLDVRRLADGDEDTLRALVHDASLSAQFDKFAGAEGFAHKWHDTRLAREGVHVARVDGELAGFALAWRLESTAGRWAMTRVGVRERFRRRGIGRALAEALVAWLRAQRPGEPCEIVGSAWTPAPGAPELAARLQFAHERCFWLMTRPRGAAPVPAWPAGVTVRGFDRSDAMASDWDDAYNTGFADHYRFVPSTPEHTRAILDDPTFRPDGTAIAYRDGRPVGFCYNVLHEHRGEVSTLGVVPGARGIGLGRALLRWGVRWLEANSTTPVTLIVDGENENALGLYRAEGFAVTRTRELWGRTFEALA